MFKTVLMSTVKPTSTNVREVEAAMSNLESTLACIGKEATDGFKVTPSEVTGAVDDDDDFVTPPVQGKGKGKRVVRHSEGDLAASERVMVPTPTPVHDILSSGSGFAHKGGKTKAYSMYTRFLAMEDWFAGMDSSVIATKYGTVSSRSLRRWLEEFGRGEYDQCMEWDKKNPHEHPTTERRWTPP